MLSESNRKGQEELDKCNAICINIALCTHYTVDGVSMGLSNDNLFRCNRRLARERWGQALSSNALETLRAYSKEFGFSISAGDLLLLDKGWYVTHSGLIRLARRNRCQGILVYPAQEFCNPGQSR
jgi:hypothetical protein